MGTTLKRRAAAATAGLFVALGAALAISSPAVAGDGGKNYQARSYSDNCSCAANYGVRAYGVRTYGVGAYVVRPLAVYPYSYGVYPYGGGVSSFSIGYSSTYPYGWWY